MVGWFVFVGGGDVAALVGDPVGDATGLTVGEVEVAADVGNAVGVDVGKSEGNT